MLRYFFIALLLLHGGIHLLGFLKAFNSDLITQLSKEIDKPEGIAWLIAAILFLVTAITFFLNVSYWWVFGLISIVLSQILTIMAWEDAQFGTLANGIILIAVLLNFFNWNFEKEFKREYEEGLQRTTMIATELVTEQHIAHLPTPVQSYLRYVGVIGKPKVQQVKITFTGSMRNKEQDWFPFTSEQYNFFDEPTRLFFMKGSVKGLPTYGYHKYKDQSASMLIKVLSAIPVVHQEDLFQAETVTLFNDMCLLAPATLISPTIQWETIDDLSAKAIFTNEGVSITATLYFNDNGQLINFVSDDRYDVSNENQYRFSTPISDYRAINGYNLCHYGEAIWHYPEGKFVYGKFNLQTVTYNLKKPSEEVYLWKLLRTYYQKHLF